MLIGLSKLSSDFKSQSLCFFSQSQLLDTMRCEAIKNDIDIQFDAECIGINRFSNYIYSKYIKLLIFKPN